MASSDQPHQLSNASFPVANLALRYATRAFVLEESSNLGAVWAYESPRFMDTFGTCEGSNPEGEFYGYF